MKVLVELEEDEFLAFLQFKMNQRKRLRQQKPKIDEVNEKIMSSPLSRMMMTIRTNNLLKCADINTIGDLLEKTEVDILKIPNVGKNTLQEIIATLSLMGLSLGQRIHREGLTP